MTCMCVYVVAALCASECLSLSLCVYVCTCLHARVCMCVRGNDRLDCELLIFQMAVWPQLGSNKVGVVDLWIDMLR